MSATATCRRRRIFLEGLPAAAGPRRVAVSTGCRLTVVVELGGADGGAGGGEWRRLLVVNGGGGDGAMTLAATVVLMVVGLWCCRWWRRRGLTGSAAGDAEKNLSHTVGYS